MTARYCGANDESETSVCHDVRQIGCDPGLAVGRCCHDLLELTEEDVVGEIRFDFEDGNQTTIEGIEALHEAKFGEPGCGFGLPITAIGRTKNFEAVRVRFETDELTVKEGDLAREWRSEEDGLVADLSFFVLIANRVRCVGNGIASAAVRLAVVVT